jgi:hypothetical protein
MTSSPSTDPTGCPRRSVASASAFCATSIGRRRAGPSGGSTASPTTWCHTSPGRRRQAPHVLCAERLSHPRRHRARLHPRRDLAAGISALTGCRRPLSSATRYRHRPPCWR